MKTTTTPTPVIVRLRLDKETAERLERCAAASYRDRARMATWLLRNVLDLYEQATTSGTVADEDFPSFLNILKTKPVPEPTAN